MVGSEGLSRADVDSDYPFSYGQVRNLGAPVDLAGRYFIEGADEVTFLNITGFRDFPLGDLPMLEVGRPLISWQRDFLLHL